MITYAVKHVILLLQVYPGQFSHPLAGHLSFADYSELKHVAIDRGFSATELFDGIDVWLQALHFNSWLRTIGYRNPSSRSTYHTVT